MNIKSVLAAMVVASATCATQASSLPEGYEKVKFITSSGTQFVDTQVEPDATTIVTVNWLSLKPSGADFQVFVGTKSADGTQQMTALLGSANNLQGGVLGASAALENPTFTWNENDRHTVTLDAVAKTISVDDGAEVWTKPQTADSLPSIYLCARHASAGAENFASGRLYGCKITKGGDLVRNFVPCRRTQDGTLGLYDLAKGGFYGNDGTGRFTGAEEVFAQGYVRVKAVSSCDGAYVDTGIVPRGRIPQIDITYRLDAFESGTNAYVFGYYDNGVTKGLAIGYQQDAGRIRYRAYDKTCDGDAPDTDEHTVTLNGPDGTWVDGERISTELCNVKDEGTDIPYYVFARCFQGPTVTPRANSVATATISKLQIWMDGDLVRDFVPCVRTSDGAVGFFDLMDALFFGNAKSDGGVLFVTEKRSDFVFLPYLESDGSQYVDTGIAPDDTTILTLDWQSLKKEDTDFQVPVGTKSDNNQMTCLIGRSNDLQGGVLGASGSLSPKFIWAEGERHTVTLDAVENRISLDGGKQVWSTTPDASPSRSFYLFARHTTGGVDAYAAGRLYGCTIIKDGELVRDYVPARRKAGGPPGLYDRVSGKFWYSAGSSPFTAPEPPRGFAIILR